MNIQNEHAAAPAPAPRRLLQAAVTLAALGLAGVVALPPAHAQAPLHLQRKGDAPAPARGRAAAAAPAQPGDVTLPPAPFGGARGGSRAPAAGLVRTNRFDPNLNDINAARWYNFGTFGVQPTIQQLMGIPVEEGDLTPTSFVTGRVNGVAYDPVNPQIFYAATAGGGVWKYGGRGSNIGRPLDAAKASGDYGDWKPLGENFPITATNCVAVPRQNRNLILVGTGDFEGRFVEGVGFMRSANGGNSWINVRFDTSGQAIGTVSSIVFDPQNPNVVLATTYRPQDISVPTIRSGSGGQILRSVDGGITWSRVTPATTLDDHQEPSNENPKVQIGEGWSDIEFGAANGRYAQGGRYVWAVNRRGGLYRSDNNGQTFRRVAPNADDRNAGPEVNIPRNPLVDQFYGPVFPTGPDTSEPAPVYFSFAYNPVKSVLDTFYPRPTTAPDSNPPNRISPPASSGLPQTPDARPDRNDPFRGRYGLEVAASPLEPETVYVIDSNANSQDGRLWRSRDAGRTWDEITGFFLTTEGVRNNWQLSDYTLALTAMPARLGSLQGTAEFNNISEVLFGAAREVLWSDNAGLDWLRIGRSLSPEEDDVNGAQFHVDQHDVAYPKSFVGGVLQPASELLIANDGGVYRVENFFRSNRGGKPDVDRTLNQSLIVTQFYAAAFHPFLEDRAFGGTYNNGFIRTSPDASDPAFRGGQINSWQTIKNPESVLMVGGPGRTPVDTEGFIEPDADINPDTRETIFLRSGDNVSDLEEELSVRFYEATDFPLILAGGNQIGLKTGLPEEPFARFPNPKTDLNTTLPGWQFNQNLDPAFLIIFAAAEPAAAMGNEYGGAAAYDPNDPNTQYATTQGTGQIYLTRDNWATSLEITPNRPLYAFDDQGRVGPVTFDRQTVYAFGRAQPQDTAIPTQWEGESKAPTAVLKISQGLLYTGAQYLWRYDRSAKRVDEGGIYFPADFANPNDRYLQEGSIDRGFWRRVGSTQLATDEGSYITAVAFTDSGRRIYVGTSDGNLWMTETGLNGLLNGNSGIPALTAGWRRLNVSTLPSRNESPQVRRAITTISVNPRSQVDGAASFSDILVGVEGAGVFRCANTLGQQIVFTEQNGTVPGRRLRDVTVNVRSIVRDEISTNVDGAPDSTNSFFVGTDRGVYYTNDQGSSWFDVSAPFGLPYVDIRSLDLNVGTGFLNVATFGRGLWRFNLRTANENQKPAATAPKFAYTASLNRSGTQIYVNVTLRNDGGTVENVNVTGVRLQVGTRMVNATSITPTGLGTLGAGSSGAKSFSAQFPATIGRRGTVATLSFSGTYSGSPFGNTFPSTQNGNTPAPLRLRLP